MLAFLLPTGISLQDGLAQFLRFIRGQSALLLELLVMLVAKPDSLLEVLEGIECGRELRQGRLSSGMVGARLQDPDELGVLGVQGGEEGREGFQDALHRIPDQLLEVPHRRVHVALRVLGPGQENGHLILSADLVHSHQQVVQLVIRNQQGVDDSSEFLDDRANRSRPDRMDGRLWNRTGQLLVGLPK